MSACRVAVIEGDVSSGASFMRPIGGGLEVFLQPTASGWILRMVPVSDPWVKHDYAELATPPYNSMTPLSLTTDFSFRAQDAVGWNPRAFRFVADRASYEQLLTAYDRLETFGGHPSPESERDMARLVAKASPGSLRIVDARLIPGMADQWRVAGAVASHFNSTAHRIEQPADGKATPLGKLLWIRFQVELQLPPGFKPDASLKLASRACGGE